MNLNPRVAIVIVNWNKKDETLNLLKSLEGIDYENHEVIVVDNASNDGSVEGIEGQFPDIKLIVNPENIGGTGGFNTGIRYALGKGDFKYVWLLDNDARVENDTLNRLIKAMEEDETIGIAGSRIVDTERRDITVEAGAFIRWDTIDVKPLFRNKENLKIGAEIEDVDYVAICSALVRVSSLNKVGLLDERFFFFWDDMDWGLRFKKNRFRVVAVLNSVAYHPAFTEKRDLHIDLYYGSRNALLTYAKHADFLKRIPIFFNYLRFRSTSLIFFGLSGRKDLMRVGAKGIWDFVVGTWGRNKLGNFNLENHNVSCDFPKEVRSILILNNGSRNEIFAALNELRQSFPDSEFTLLIAEDRLGIYNDNFQHIIRLNSKKLQALIYNSTVFLKILFKNYDIAVNPKYPSPFSFAVKRVYDFNYTTKGFIESMNNRKNIWKLIVSAILGEVIGVLIFPVVYASSFIHGKSE